MINALIIRFVLHHRSTLHQSGPGLAAVHRPLNVNGGIVGLTHADPLHRAGAAIIQHPGGIQLAFNAVELIAIVLDEIMHSIHHRTEIRLGGRTDIMQAVLVTGAYTGIAPEEGGQIAVIDDGLLPLNRVDHILLLAGHVAQAPLGGDHRVYRVVLADLRETGGKAVGIDTHRIQIEIVIYIQIAGVGHQSTGGGGHDLCHHIGDAA